jgi:hypothetical protein
MAIWGWGSPACCCQPAVAGGFIYADLRSELNTHPAPQAMLLRVLLGTTATATSCPLSKHTREGDIARAFSGHCVYLQFMWEVGSGPSSLSYWVFLPLPILQAFPLLVAVCVRHSCLLWPASLFTVQWRIAPSQLFGTQSTLPSLLCVFFVIAYFSVSLFSLGKGRSVLGAMLIWPRVFCGSTACCLAHLGICIFPSHLGAGVDGGSGALLVSPFDVKWWCYACGGGVEESKFCLFLVVFPVMCTSSVFPRFYIRKHAFCFLPLAVSLESTITIFTMLNL